MSDSDGQLQIPDEPAGNSPLMKFTRLIHERRAASTPKAAARVENRMRKLVEEHSGNARFVERAKTLLQLEFLREREEGGQMER